MYLFFDTETTGLPRNWKAPVTDTDNWPRMIQLAWVEADFMGQIQAEHNYIIKPEGFVIPVEASNVHGITTEKAIAEGRDLHEILQIFAQSIAKNELIIAHNIAFDEKIAGAEFIRENIDHELFAKPQLCTMQKSTNYCRLPGRYGKYKWPSLA